MIEEYKENTLCIGWVTLGSVENSFTKSLSTCILQRKSLIDSIVTCEGNVLPIVRNKLIEEFLIKTESEWLLMIDSDVVFYAEDIDEVLSVARHEDVKIVSGVIYLKRCELDELIPEPGVMKINNEGNLKTIWDIPQDQHFEIDGGSLGFTLVHRSVLINMKKSRPELTLPWFYQKEEDNIWLGEDISFFRRAAEDGYKIFATSRVFLGHVKKIELNKKTYQEYYRNKTI